MTETMGNPAPSAGNGKKLYAVGTLRYTLLQLIWVFVWMLWGALAMHLLNSMFNSATPFLFRRYGLSDTQIVLILSSFLSLMNMVMNPILSFKSDRCRSRIGRRRPFILYTALPLGASLALLPWWPKLASLLPQLTLGGVDVTGFLLGAGAVVYIFFFLFVGSIYYYYIPDVIPAELMGRYYGFFRTAGTLAGMVYSKFLFAHAVSHPQLVYPVVGVFYTISAVLMCWFVREGEYPAEEKAAALPLWSRLRASVASYVTECFSQKYYWCFYLFGTALGISACVNSFNNFFYLDACSFSLETIGTLNVWLGVVGFSTCILAGYPVDRLGGFRCAIVALGFMSLFHFLGGFFIHDYVSALLWRCPLQVANGVYAVSSGRIILEVFPRSRFGQFASAQAMVISLLVALVNYPVGKFSDVLKTAGSDTVWVLCGVDVMPLLHRYRFINYWNAGCTLTAMVMLLVFLFHFQLKRTEQAADL